MTCRRVLLFTTLLLKNLELNFEAFFPSFAEAKES